MLMPHESTVAHEQKFSNNLDFKTEQIIKKKQEFISKRADSRVPHLFPEAPKKETTQAHELDDEDEDAEDANEDSASSVSCSD